MGPFQKRSLAWFKKAFQNYYAELHGKGPVPLGENVAARFVEGRIGPESGK